MQKYLAESAVILNTFSRNQERVVVVSVYGILGPYRRFPCHQNHSLVDWHV
jgi:hypothetical protein